MTDLVLILLVSLGAVHIGIPSTYFAIMRRIASNASYRLTINLQEEPSVSILIPTYNEALVIEKKIRNINEASYPREKIEVLVVDSGSNDHTADLAKDALKWAGLNGSVIQEEVRKGKSFGLNLGLSQASGDLVCISDAECTWDKNALKNAARYFSDPSIGSVSGIHEITGSRETLSVGVENSYRSIYRMLRVAESKVYSTPVAEGELQLFRKGQFVEFDTSIGGDDTWAALSMVQKGFRAISAEDVVFYEPTPASWRARFSQKIRRGQHVVQAFLKHRGLLRGRGVFSRVIFPMEIFLYIINPLLFPVFLATTLVLAIISLPFAVFIGAATVVAFLVPPLSKAALTHITNSLTMLAALVNEAKGEKQLVWTKIEENRSASPMAEIPVATG